jgi:hypothetical protein
LTQPLFNSKKVIHTNSFPYKDGFIMGTITSLPAYRAARGRLVEGDANAAHPSRPIRSVLQPQQVKSAKTLAGEAGAFWGKVHSGKPFLLYPDFQG